MLTVRSVLPPGLTTIAVVDCKETYENMAVSLKDVFDEINTLVEAGGIEINGERVLVELFIGGDMKVSF